MNKFLAVAALLVVFGGTARAQVSSTNDTQSAAQAISAPMLNFNTTAPAHSTQTLRNTPDAGAPGIFAGTNPCAVGVSAGVGLPGFGLAGGMTYTDSGCERRNLAGALYTMGMVAAAKEVLCANEEVRAAFRRIRQPCAADLPDGMLPEVPPAARPAVPRHAANTVVVTPDSNVFLRPDWCATVDRNNAAEMARARAACGG